ncbi:MAG: glycosyltransferase [Ancrocorticia sp.]
MSAPSLPQVPVTVAILTFKREHLLQPMVEAVAHQCVELDADISIVVVDNDPARSAEPIIAPLTQRYRLRYVNEPTPGIAVARNAALRSAGDSRLLVFIDDDELPEPGWLRHLLTHWEKARCEVVVGPQDFVLPDPVPDTWVIASGLFDNSRHPTGSRRQGASSANLLLDLDFLRAHNLSFDARLGLAGGEDTLLAHQILAAGGRIEWCNEAIVSEPVPLERITRQWMRQRVYRSGASWARAVIVTTPAGKKRFIARAKIAVRSVIRIILSGVQLGYGLLRRDERRVARQARTIYSLAGALSALVGARQVEDYSRN